MFMNKMKILLKSISCFQCRYEYKLQNTSFTFYVFGFFSTNVYM